MKWSWKVGEVAGIGILAHWTFLVLIAVILAASLAAGSSAAAAVEGVAFILAIFGCVVLHELGHALMARQYGIRTTDITLLPIGGVARLERLPEDPRQELWIALAGPVVNLVIAAVLFVVINALSGLAALYDIALVGGGFMAKLMWTNLGLVAFNLLPAFPMDGGRVLRALLAQHLNYVRATRIAAYAGQAMAILFGILSFFSGAYWFMLFIALFVYVGAEQEARMVQTHALLKDGNTRTAMMTRFRALSPHSTLAAAAIELLNGPQEDFPVLDDSRLVGVLPRNTLIKALAQTGPDAFVDAVMCRDVPIAEEGDTLEDTFEKMRSGGCSSLPVLREGHLVGVVTLNNIEDWVMVRAALDRSQSVAEVEQLLET